MFPPTFLSPSSGRLDMTASPNTQTPTPRPAAAQPTRSFTLWLWEWTKSILVALVVWFLLRTFLVEAFRIPSGSMEKTLLIGDFLFVNKALYGAEVPLVHAHLLERVLERREHAGVQGAEAGRHSRLRLG